MCTFSMCTFSLARSVIRSLRKRMIREQQKAMPEGDTIRRLADSLTAKFAGQTVKSSMFRHAKLATVDLAGVTLLEADARGKHLLMRFSNRLTLHVHLKMTGAVYSRFAREVRPDRRKFEFAFNNGWATAVDVPILELIKTRDEHGTIGHLGPDVCGRYDHAAGVQRLTTAGERPIADALLDQTLVAGFGNIYAVETPFIVGINPFTCVSSISDIDGLLSLAVGIIRTNARLGPQNTTGKDLRRNNHWVLGRRTFECKVCGATIQRLAGPNCPWQRRTAWCAECQPPDTGKVDFKRAARLLSLHPCRRIVRLTDGKLMADVSQPVKSEVQRAPFRRA